MVTAELQAPEHSPELANHVVAVPTCCHHSCVAYLHLVQKCCGHGQVGPLVRSPEHHAFVHRRVDRHSC